MVGFGGGLSGRPQKKCLGFLKAGRLQFLLPVFEGKPPEKKAKNTSCPKISDFWATCDFAGCGLPNPYNLYCGRVCTIFAPLPIFILSAQQTATPKILDGLKFRKDWSTKSEIFVWLLESPFKQGWAGRTPRNFGRVRKPK